MGPHIRSSYKVIQGYPPLESIELARSYKGKIWATAGIHPHNASNASENFKDDLMAILNHNEVVAIGECGLDYFRNFSSKEEQRNQHTQLVKRNSSDVILWLERLRKVWVSLIEVADYSQQ